MLIQEQIEVLFCRVITIAGVIRVIFNHRYADDILALEADSGGVRSLFNVYSDDIHYVSVDTDAVLRDIDTPEDYRDAINVVDFSEIDL